MDTISTLNAIKGVFATLGAKTSNSNYAVPLVDKTSAEPKGFMEMANLASVLGADADIILNRNAEWNVSLFIQGKLRTGIYCFEAKTTDGFPINTNALMVLINGEGGVGRGFNVALLVELNGIKWT